MRKRVTSINIKKIEGNSEIQLRMGNIDTKQKLNRNLQLEKAT